MPRSNGEINQNQAAVRGIVTEASPLNFPEGASLDEKNFVLSRDGRRKRRFGIDIEAEGTATTLNSSDVVSVYEWVNAGEEAENDFVVVQYGSKIALFDATSEPLSDGYLQTIDLPGWTGREIEAAIVSDSLVIAYGAVTVLRLTVDSAGTTFTATEETPKIRDLFGVDDPLDVTTRPSSLSTAHAYNLANQGWLGSAASQLGSRGWPSNADIYSAGVGVSAVGDFDERVYDKPTWGNTPAPKGSAIINPLAPSSGREELIVERGFPSYNDPSIYNDLTSRGATSVASYAGRVFYAGFGPATNRVNDTYPDLTSYVLFSQTIEADQDFSKCYQEADPAALDTDLVDTDGGFVTIPEAGRIFKLVSTGRSVLVIASGGVWEIYSTDQIFSPGNYQVSKVTNIGALNKKSVVLAGDIVFYWSDYGIQALSITEVSQQYSSQNVIEQSIQTLYDEIPTASKREASGFFDRFDKKLRWLYDSTNRTNKYDSELIFDFTLQAWYRNEIATRSDGVAVSGYVPLPDIIRQASTANVVASGDNVIAGADNVVAPSTEVVIAERTFKYLAKDGADVLFAEFNNTDYSDWGETDADAFVLTGYYTGGDTVRKKAVTYLTVHMDKTETGFEEDVDGNWIPVNASSCLTQVRWEWSDNAVAGRFTNTFEAYRHRGLFFPVSLSDQFENGYPVVTTKNRVRGSGRAMNIKFSTSAGKDLSLLGWNLQVGANSKV